MTRKGEQLTGIIHKCTIPEESKDFLATTGLLWPCCYLYTNKNDLVEWAEKYGFNTNLEDIDLNKHTIAEIHNSKFMQKFLSNFDTQTCRKECGANSWTNPNNSKRLDIE